jgi:peroxiredoxin
MRNLSIHFFILFLVFSSCKNENIQISGTIEGYTDSTRVILSNLDNEKGVDTTYIFNNQFTFTVSNSEPVPHGLFIGIEYDFLFFWLEDSNVTIKGTRDNLKYALTKGGEVEKQDNEFQKFTRMLTLRLDSVRQESRKAFQQNDLQNAQILQKQMENLIQERIKLGATFIKENPNKLISAFALEGYIPGLPKSEIKLLYENLSPKIKESRYAKSVSKYLETSKEMNIGDIAEDFQLSDLYGNFVCLKDFKGKFVLLDFWSSGCKPCRIEHKNFLKNYEKYKDKGFEIISVTSDKNKKTWESATKEDSMIWVSLQDDASESGRVGTKYNVKLIPENFLINPNGKIIAMNLHGNKLGEKLNEIFKE